MVSCTEYDVRTNVGTFFIDTLEEIVNIPDLKNEGKAEIAGMHKINIGSMAMLPNGSVYVLTGENAENGGTWKIFG